MKINVKNRILYKARKAYYLTPMEVKMILMLSNGEWNYYDEIRGYIYKRNICNRIIKERFKELRKKIKIYIRVNNIGIRMDEAVIIEWC